MPDSETRNAHDPSVAQKQSSERLSGWAAIEQHLFKHDGEEMKYYTDDIDTLLVFAGLFSAFLTAFVVQTYPMLVEDDLATTNQLLALSVATQLQVTGTIIPSTINSTISSLLQAPPFTPPASARAINSLFFLSLVLSLSAAFFGILAKQWIREYLRWNSPLALPRENVLVRQERIEAFEEWNVGGGISLIPALLELAMIMFLLGIVILLWTLDDVVAIIVTVFAAFFLLAVAAFTVLPVLFSRCPYKSPTAWACLKVFHGAKSILQSCRKDISWRLLSMSCIGGTYFARYVNLPQIPTPASWRVKDHKSCREVRAEVNGRSPTLREAWEAAENLASEHEQRDEVPITAFTDIAETALLVRALAWVKQSSQDPRVQASVAECSEDIHPTDDPDKLIVAVDAELLSVRCLILSLQNNRLYRPHSGLFLYDQPTEASFAEEDDRTHHDTATASSTHRRRSQFLKNLVSMGYWDHHLLPPSISDIVAQLLLADLRRHIARGEACQEAVFETCAVIQRLASVGERTEADAAWYQDALEIMLSLDYGKSDSIPDLRESVISEAARRSRLAVTDGGTLEFTATKTTCKQKEALLQLMVNNRPETSSYPSAVFLVVASTWFESDMQESSALEDPSGAGPILLTISDTIDSASGTFEEDRPMSFTVNVLLHALHHHISTSPTLPRPNAAEFRVLAHSLEKAFQRHLLDVENNSLQLHDILLNLHTNVFTCETAGCRWVSHFSGDEPHSGRECPILEAYRHSLPESTYPRQSPIPSAPNSAHPAHWSRRAGSRAHFTWLRGSVSLPFPCRRAWWRTRNPPELESGQPIGGDSIPLGDIQTTGVRNVEDVDSWPRCGDAERAFEVNAGEVAV